MSLYRALILILIVIICATAAAGYSHHIEWLGKLFINLLKLLAVPLVFVSVVSGVVALGRICKEKDSKREISAIAGITAFYFLATTLMAALLGLVLAVYLMPSGFGLQKLGTLGTSPSQLLDDLRSSAPPSISDWFITMLVPLNLKLDTLLLPLTIWAIIFGAALVVIGERARPLITNLDVLHEAMLTLAKWLMYFAPVGIAAILASELSQGSAWNLIVTGSKYMGAVLFGLALHFLILLLILAFIAERRWSYVANNWQALVTAFSTASSAATLPMTMKCAQENNIDPRVTRFVIPLGATLNKNGAALYITIAVITAMQVCGQELGLAQQAAIVVTAMLVAIGCSGTPQVVQVTLVLALTLILPAEVWKECYFLEATIALLFALDWFLDRFCTVVNVWGDAVGAAVVDKFLPVSTEVALDE